MVTTQVGDHYVLGFAPTQRVLQVKFCADSIKVLMPLRCMRTRKDHMHVKDPVVHTCQSLVDYGKAKITQHALEVPES